MGPKSSITKGSIAWFKTFVARVEDQAKQNGVFPDNRALRLGCFKRDELIFGCQRRINFMGIWLCVDQPIHKFTQHDFIISKA